MSKFRALPPREPLARALQRAERVAEMHKNAIFRPPTSDSASASESKKSLVIAAVREMLDGDEDAVVRWLHRPILSLDGKTPVLLLDTTDGIEQVLEHITRLQRGMMS